MKLEINLECNGSCTYKSNKNFSGSFDLKASNEHGN